MRLEAVLLMVAWVLQAIPGGPKETEFRYRRQVVRPAEAVGAPTCAVLDGTVYAHAAPALADLRLFGDGATGEIPYAFTVSETGFSSDAATVLNLGMEGQTVTFDLQMPDRFYSGLILQLGGENFLAAAKITGLRALRDRDGAMLGTFTIFDLSRQRLGRNTAVALAESSFPYLHVELNFSNPPGEERFVATPGLVQGALVPPSREAQTLYTTVAETRTVVVRGRESVAEFLLPAHVPVERVSFELAPKFAGSFSRPVRITAKAVDATGSEAPASEEVAGEIARVRLTESGEVIRTSSLSVPAILGSNVQRAAKVEVAVKNGDDRPVELQGVRLEMRQRKLCFAAPGEPATLYYGAAGMKGPTYDYSRLFQPAEAVAVARLGPEIENPGYVARVEVKSFSERHPGIIWVALVGMVLVLGGVAWRSAKRV